MNTQQVCEVIRFELLRRKISQRELERRFGWGHAYLSNVLTGRLDLKVKTLLQVLEALQMDPTDFFETVKRIEAVHGRPDAPGERAPLPQPLVEPDRMERLFDLMVEAGRVAQELREDKESGPSPGEPRRGAGGRSGG